MSATKKPANNSVWATLPPITAGALSTAVAMYPVDLVRALKMSSAAEADASLVTLLRNFHAAHGAKGFVTQGLGPEMARATYMRVLKFFLFPITHRQLYGKGPGQGTIASKAVAAAVCSLPEGFTITPLEVAKIGLQLDKEKKFNNNSTLFIRHIMKTRGWTGLFIGYTGIQYRQTSWTAAYFATLDFFQEKTTTVLPSDWKATQQLVGGLAAGVFGAVFNTPGDVIRSAIQKKVFAEPAPLQKQGFSLGLCAEGVKDFFAMGQFIAQKRGVTALWAGFGVKAIHLGGSGALLAALIPFFKSIMGVEQD